MVRRRTRHWNSYFVRSISIGRSKSWIVLPSFHVKGLITRIGETLVTLEGVEVISNDSGEAIESPNQMSVKINDILSVSDAQEAEEPE